MRARFPRINKMHDSSKEQQQRASYSQRRRQQLQLGFNFGYERCPYTMQVVSWDPHQHQPQPQQPEPDFG
ncbi:uncharacterized protein DMAD_10812 [Drosophila madeirensis]|uniref:Uncharacterized protein n=1 Tax=Drosophila madeirensis TaxID=30013 RepID=A0AAU9FB02_DROMD